MTARIEVQRESPARRHHRGCASSSAAPDGKPGFATIRWVARRRATSFTRFECSYGGAEVFRASMGAGIAANPYLRFFVRAERSGDIECRWVRSGKRFGIRECAGDGERMT